MESNNRWFQWISGNRKGEILVFDNIVSEDGVIYISFKDGSRINESFVAQINQRDLTGKMMAEIDSPNNAWKFKEVETKNEGPRYEVDANTGLKYEVPPVNEIVTADLTSEGGVTRPTAKPKAKRIELIPPRPTPPSHSIFGKIQKSFDTMSSESHLITNVQSNVNQSQQKLPELPRSINYDDPVFILMSKAKKIDMEISMGMTVALPTKNLYNIAKESFDDGDKKFIDYIVSDITVDEIKEALKIAIRQMYEDSEDINS
jgi:hypothetical protein